mgnify:CR=1 FL=1
MSYVIIIRYASCHVNMYLCVRVCVVDLLMNGGEKRKKDRKKERKKKEKKEGG